MRNVQLVLLCFICFAKSYGQTVTKSYGRVDVEITKEKKQKKIDIKVEIKSAITGGDTSWVQSLKNSLNESIRVDRRAKKGRHLVSVQFVVDKEGSLSDVRCVNDPGFGMCEEVMRVVKKFSMWRPGSGQVRTYRKSSTTY